MKVISLWQPWASLAVMGYKKIETRGYNTKHRGPLLIHAAAKKFKPVPGMEDLMSHMVWCGFFDKIKHMPYGAIIGCVNVVSTKPTPDPFDGKLLLDNWIYELTEQEFAFGNYSPGRFGWLLSDPLQFKDPIPAKGMQGFWKPDEATELICKIAIERAKINPQP